MATLQSLISPTTTQVAQLESGWYMLVACVVGLLLSGTRVAPISTGILAVAAIYQINLMLQGK